MSIPPFMELFSDCLLPQKSTSELITILRSFSYELLSGKFVHSILLNRFIFSSWINLPLNLILLFKAYFYNLQFFLSPSITAFPYSHIYGTHWIVVPYLKSWYLTSLLIKMSSGTLLIFFFAEIKLILSYIILIRSMKNI